MAFLRSSSGIDADAEVHGRQLFLRHPAMGDYAAWAELRALSRQHLTVWEPQWARDELTRSAFRRRLRQYQRELREDLGYAFLIFRRGRCDAARRAQHQQRPARRRPGRVDRLLDRRSPHPAAVT